MEHTEDSSTGTHSEPASPGFDPVAAQDSEPAATNSEPAVDEQQELDALESDMAAVERAITTLDEISARGIGGELAASEISAAVSRERFGS